MIKKMMVTNYLGETLDIILPQAMPSHGLLLISADGIGPSGANIHTTALAVGDGSIYNSANKTQRNIVLEFLFTEAPLIEDARHLTYKYFPEKKPVVIGFETDRRKLEAYGYVEKNEPNIFSDQEGCQISIICTDPYFYDIDENGKQVSYFSGVEPLFEFIFSNESLTDPLLEFGSIENQSEKLIFYKGDAEVGITMTIHFFGANLESIGSKFYIYNTTTNQVMILDITKLKAMIGGNVLVNDEIIITTTRQSKSIRFLRSGVYTNVLNCIDVHSEWINLAKGDNVFVYRLEPGMGNVQFKIENDVLYEGV